MPGPKASNGLGRRMIVVPRHSTVRQPRPKVAPDLRRQPGVLSAKSGRPFRFLVTQVPHPHILQTHMSLGTRAGVLSSAS